MAADRRRDLWAAAFRGVVGCGPILDHCELCAESFDPVLAKPEALMEPQSL